MAAEAVQDKILLDIDEWMDEKRQMYEDEKNGVIPSAIVDEKEKAFNPVDPSKPKEAFRDYERSARQKRVERLYHLQHKHQTFEFVLSMEKKYLDKYRQPHSSARGLRMGVWDALEYMDTMVDDSDPDTNLSQVAHALQTAEAVRQRWPDNHWFQVAGLIHDLGKIMSIRDQKLGLTGEPQWAVVGDTFPVGAPFSEKNVFPESFRENPDTNDPRYNSGLGIYKRNCGLMNVKMSWGHDEYLYQVCINNGTKLPTPALYMIRFHSFYPWHREGAYEDLLSAEDISMLRWIKEFNEFDLYSKADDLPDIEALKPYYQKLILEYFPAELLW